jgi:hypothetical protein
MPDLSDRPNKPFDLWMPKETKAGIQTPQNSSPANAIRTNPTPLPFSRSVNDTAIHNVETHQKKPI